LLKTISCVFVALTEFGGQAFDFASFFLRIGISLRDFAWEEEYALGP
jgi:hypothetical protein